jgi:DNA polymerase
MADLTKLHEQIRSCTKCALSKTRTNAVPGEGNFNAEIMFVGEAPGKSEDEKGEPFVGAAGKFLDELLLEIGLKRGDVFITNVVKCRPPENRDPLDEEIQACWPYLETQINEIKPKLIVTLGRHAMYRFLPGDLKISKVHGRAKRYKGIWDEKQVYFPMYHPAVALYNGSYRETLKNDIKKIPKVLEKIG